MVSAAFTNNITRIARLVLWVMLLQTFSITAHAVLDEPGPDGYMASICTSQGYQTIWIDLEQDSGEELGVTECPHCLFNLITADVVFSSENQLAAAILPQVNLTPFQTKLKREWYQYTLPIRAPPYVI